MTKGDAAAGFVVTLFMLAGSEVVLQIDAWARAKGWGWLMQGSREWAVRVAWFLRACIVGVALYFLAILIGVR